MGDDLKTIIDTMNKRFDKLDSRFDEIDKRFKTQEKSLRAISVAQQDTRKEAKTNAAKIAETEAKLLSFKSDVEEQKDVCARLNNVIINGIPFKENEKLHLIFNEISSLLGYDRPPDCIFYRFKGTENTRRPIMVKFTNQLHKQWFLERYFKIATHFQSIQHSQASI